MGEINTEEEEENVSMLTDKGTKKTECKVRWNLPSSTRHVTFIGKNILSICHDLYIIFIDLKTSIERIYHADGKIRGDGVDCISGHRSSMFAFAEKCSQPRIFIMSYPSLLPINELSDTDIHRYKAVCMAENDLVVGYSGIPNFVITVWSWRTSQKLVSLLRTNVNRNEFYIPSNTHCLVAEIWSKGFNVREIAPCFKLCMVMKWQYRGDKTEISAACWSQEGHLYYIDSYANLYGVLSDGIGMTSNLEWSSNTSGQNYVAICAYNQGLLIYCPDGVFKYLKKVEKEWDVIWTYVCQYPIIQLISNGIGLLAVAWSEQGHIFIIKNDVDESVIFQLFVYKHRKISKVQIVNPEGKYCITLNENGEMCVYDVAKSHLVDRRIIEGEDMTLASNPVRPLLAVCGQLGGNYGVSLLRAKPNLELASSFCLTYQIVSRIAFSATGTELVAAAMSAGQLMLLKVKDNDKMTMLRCIDIGRALSDCLLIEVGTHMRLLALVLYSDKYKIGEKIVCINAVTLQDNKFAGKMYGPYTKLISCSVPNIMIAIPLENRQLHMMQLIGDKGQTVQVKVIKKFDSGHDIRGCKGSFSPGGFVTYGFDGHVILRQPDCPEEYDFKIVGCHRYKSGIRYALVDPCGKYILCLAFSKEVTIHYLDSTLPEIQEDIVIKSPRDLLKADVEIIPIFDEDQKNWFDLEEDRLVETERLEYAVQKEEVVAMFNSLQNRLVNFLEQNLLAPPLHQLPLVEFNLHQEAKLIRTKQAAEEREIIRLELLARIVAQDKVTEWIKEHCWIPMKTPRAKIFAIFSHYVVESYSVLASQRDTWPELDDIKCFRAIEMDDTTDVHMPWIVDKPEIKADISLKDLGQRNSLNVSDDSTDSSIKLNPNVLSGTLTHNYIAVPKYALPQLLTYSFLHMNWLGHITKYNTQNMRTWFNKQFDDLMNIKMREVGLVEERNRRLRVIISELNILAELRGSEERIYIDIKDPIWSQEEIPSCLIKVEPEEVSVTPYISPSQIVIVPPDPGPKDDFRERALMDMMDGVLEKLWHEEIKKPIPKPACMLEKSPENWNEDELRTVFDYESKVEFRNEEREKYRKMLHAEYFKLTGIVNEGIVRFNYKVKDMFVCQLKVETVIGQEKLNLMRLRRVNLDRIQAAEKTEKIRIMISEYEGEIEVFQKELKLIHEQLSECQAAYDALASKDKLQDRNFKSNFADLSPIVIDQCYKMFKKRPKWNQRATMIPSVLNEMAQVCITGVKTVFLHPDCFDFLRMLDQLDNISNMPAVMDEGLWVTMCKLRRAKIENEIRMRAQCLEAAYVDSAVAVWNKALSARKTALTAANRQLTQHKEDIETTARNRSVQLAMKAGLIEIPLSGHIEDFADATLIKMDEVEAINATILKIGRFKLALMKKHMNFRRGILAKEWEHAQLKMKIRHMEEELYSFDRLKVSKELQTYLKGKAKGWTDDQDYAKMEKEFDAEKVAFNKVLCNQIQQTEDIEGKLSQLTARMTVLEEQIFKLKIALSEKRLNTDPMEPIRRSKIASSRMATLVQRSKLVQEVQSNQTTIIMLQTELELLRLKTYPTLSTFKPVCL